MAYLDCAQYDCCHNKAGGCCLGGVTVRHAGAGDAVCSSYRCSEGVGNVATDNAPATAETDVHCTERSCRYLAGSTCRAAHISIDVSDCGPQCRTRAAAQGGN